MCDPYSKFSWQVLDYPTFYEPAMRMIYPSYIRNLLKGEGCIPSNSSLHSDSAKAFHEIPKLFRSSKWFIESVTTTVHAK